MDVVATLTTSLDSQLHAAEIVALRRCRTDRDLDRIVAAGGWLTGVGSEHRLKLVKHGTGTWLVVSYDSSGWSTRLAMAEATPRRRY